MFPVLSVEEFVARGRAAQASVDRILTTHAHRIVRDVAPEAGRSMPTRCDHCGAPLPKDLGGWIVEAGADGRLLVLCDQTCAAGLDFPP